MFLRVAMATLSREATQGTSALMFLRVAVAPLSGFLALPVHVVVKNKEVNNSCYGSSH